MLLSRWMLVLSICLICSAVKADDSVVEDTLSTDVLVEQMLSNDADAAKRATETLSEQARPALPELREALESPDPVLRELVEQAITEIRGE